MTNTNGQAPGKFIVTIEVNSEGEQVGYEYSWHGADHTRIHLSVLLGGPESQVVWDRSRGPMPLLNGKIKTFRVGPYVLEIDEIDPRGGFVLCHRSREKEEKYAQT